MTEPATLSTCFIGCDVGKAAILVFDSTTCRCHQIANTPDALGRFAATLPPGCLTIANARLRHEGAAQLS
ncbi:hypothetical protein [Sphingomonas adhaesiva]|uniref:hypothetical protein n=1 Tax=Sphingomonas adhaesiva TaxID=28212 RepID=UPI002FF51ED4